MQSIEAKIFIYVIVIMSAIFHEYAHAWMAYYLGDPTAKNAGRLTLNPIAHIDPFGTVLLPLFLLLTGGIFIGYAKPVPFNPYNLNDQKYGSVKVAMAGPGSNFLIAILLSALLRYVTLPAFWGEAVMIIVYVNIILGLFNLIPVPPLDGSKLLKRFTSFNFSFRNSFLGTIIALMLAFTFMPYLAQGVFQLLTGMTI